MLALFNALLSAFCVLYLCALSLSSSAALHIILITSQCGWDCLLVENTGLMDELLCRLSVRVRHNFRHPTKWCGEPPCGKLMHKFYEETSQTKEISCSTPCALFLEEQALQYSCEQLRQKKELHTSSLNFMQSYETACKFMKLHVSFMQTHDLHASLCNSMQAYVCSYKLM